MTGTDILRAEFRYVPTQVVGSALALLALVTLGACSSDGHDRRERDGGASGEITEDVPLLNADGTVAAHGWARAPHVQFDRSAIREEDLARLREWEYYAVFTDAFSMSFTLTDLGSFAFAIPTVEDYATGVVHSGFLLADTSVLDLPPTPFGDTRFETAGGTLEYRFDGRQRNIDVVTPQYEAHLVLEDTRDTDSIAVVHRFDAPHQFFYENKRLPMPATGSARANGETFTLPGEGAFAVLDWGRGVWPSAVRWEWAHFVGVTGGHTLGVNLGTVFGDDAPGTADAVFVDGALHKLDRVEWTYDVTQPMSPWRFSTPDGRVDLTLTPDFDDPSTVNLGAAQKLERVKAHGELTGTVTLDDGSSLALSALRGAAEYVEILW